MKSVSNLDQKLSSQAAIIIPTKNAGPSFAKVLQAVREQDGGTWRCIVIDSGSIDNTPTIALSHECELIQIRPEDFDHGETRQYGIELSRPSPFIIFLTQDAVLARKDALLQLLSSFSDPLVGACFGRQLPKKDANLIEQHARIFNYPEHNRTTSLDDARRMGIKAAFLSNSFSAYRREAIESAGGFNKTIFGEDMLAAANLLKQGWKIQYQAKALVLHSHNLSLKDEFKRHFDMGVMHSRESSLLNLFAPPTREGLKFVRSETIWLIKRAPWLIPQAWIKNITKASGYTLGKLEKHIPDRAKIILSANKNFWNRKIKTDAS